MNRDGYETAWTGPGESITGNGPHSYATEDMLGPQTYKTELTPAGEQLVMFPPAEPKPNASGKVQLNLFG
jgi:hypothetical protein